MFGAFLRGRGGDISPLFALLIVPIVGALAVGIEASNWFLTQRALQNAADSAVLSAAYNNDATTVTANGHTYARYKWEALSVASSYNLTDGSNNVTVEAQNQQRCPNGDNDCFKVTVTRKLPLYLAGIVGFTGDTTINGGDPAKTVQAVAYASPRYVPNTYCLLALAHAGTSTLGISMKGSPRADFTGCKVATNGYADCKGHNLKADEVDVAGSSSNCALTSGGNITGVPSIADPYAYLASNIPANTCGGAYAGTSIVIGDGSSATPTQTATWSSAQTACGTITLSLYSCPKKNPPPNCKSASSGILQVTQPTVLVVRNGGITLPANVTLKTSSTGSLTVIFSGPDTTGAYYHFFNIDANATLDIAAPTTGTWAGVAVYQDPAVTKNVSWSGSGNGPTWNVSGLWYMPYAAVDFSGVVNKASNGLDCFALVSDTFSSNGTASVVEHQTQCSSQGLQPPSGQSIRQALVG